MSRFPKTACTFLFGALAAVVLTGCIKTKSVINLNADGSGTLTLAITVDQSKMDELKEMMEGMGMGGGGDAGNLDEQLDFDGTAKALEGMEGVRLVSQKSLDDAEKKIKGTEMVVAFDNLQALSKSGLIENLSLELTKNEDGTYTLVMGTLPEQMEGMDVNDPMVQGQMEQFKAMMPMLEPMLGSFEMSEIIKLPGEITETNGTKAETGGNTVMWKMGFADAMDINKLTRKVTFKGDGLDWKPFKTKASEGRSAMKAARAKLKGGGATGPSAMPGSPAELEVLIAVEKARIHALESAVATAKTAAESARQAAAEAEEAAKSTSAELEQARADLAKMEAQLEKLKQPADSDK